MMLRMLQMRYERTSYISLLALLVYKSASRIQSACRGHSIRTALAPRFRASSVKPPAVTQPVRPPSAPPLGVVTNEELVRPPPMKKSATPPPSPPSLASGSADTQPTAARFPAQTLAPIGKDDMCSPVWLLQVVAVIISPMVMISIVCI